MRSDIPVVRKGYRSLSVISNEFVADILPGPTEHFLTVDDEPIAGFGIHDDIPTATNECIVSCAPSQNVCHKGARLRIFLPWSEVIARRIEHIVPLTSPQVVTAISAGQGVVTAVVVGWQFIAGF